MQFLLSLLLVPFVQSAEAKDRAINWTFQNQFEVSVHPKKKSGYRVFKDGVKKGYKCRHTDRTKIAVLKTKSGEFDIFCSNDYLGGLSVDHNVNDKVRPLTLAQMDADAGQEWSTQSEFFYHKGYLYLRQKVYSTLQDVECVGKKCKSTCSVNETYRRFEEKKGSFDRVSQFTGPARKSNLLAPKFYLAHCSGKK